MQYRLLPHMRRISFILAAICLQLILCVYIRDISVSSASVDQLHSTRNSAYHQDPSMKQTHVTPPILPQQRYHHIVARERRGGEARIESIGVHEPHEARARWKDTATTTTTEHSDNQQHQSRRTTRIPSSTVLPPQVSARAVREVREMSESSDDVPLIDQTDSTPGTTQLDAVDCTDTFNAPVIDTILAGNHELLVAFWAPPNESSQCTPILSFLVFDGFHEPSVYSRADVLPNPNLGGAFVVRLDGLTNGQVYRVVVKAVNGLLLAESDTVMAIPATTPDAPIVTTTLAGDQSVVVSFSPPLHDGGSAVTGYTVFNLNTGDVAGTGAGSPILLTGLTNGLGYRFVVVAANAMGNGPPSLPTPNIVPQPAPQAPFIFAVQSTGFSKKLKLFFFPPTNNGAVLDYYRITARTLVLVSGPGGVGTSPSSQVRTLTQTIPANPGSGGEFVNLIDGTSYNITLTAVGSEGAEGPVSNMVSIVAGPTSQSWSFFPTGSWKGYCLNATVIKTNAGGTGSDSGSNPSNLITYDFDLLSTLTPASPLLVNCTALYAPPVQPPPMKSSTGRSGGGGDKPKSSSTGVESAPPPYVSSTGPVSSSTSGSSTAAAPFIAPDSSTDSSTSITPVSSTASPALESSTGSNGESGGGGGIILFGSSTGSFSPDDLPPVGAVRLEIHMSFDSSILDAHHQPASFWYSMCKKWAELFELPYDRVKILAVDNTEDQDVPQEVHTSLFFPFRRLLAATSGNSLQDYPSRHLLAASGNKQEVTLVLDILPPLTPDDTRSSSAIAGNLTQALQDPSSPVAQSLIQVGGQVSSVKQTSNPGNVIPPIVTDDGSSGLSKTMMLGLAVGIAAVVLLGIILSVVLWKRFRKSSPSAPARSSSKQPSAIIGGSGSAGAGDYKNPNSAHPASPNPSPPSTHPNPFRPAGRRGADHRSLLMVVDPEDYAQRGRGAASGVPLSGIRVDIDDTHSPPHQQHTRASSASPAVRYLDPAFAHQAHHARSGSASLGRFGTGGTSPGDAAFRDAMAALERMHPHAVEGDGIMDTDHQYHPTDPEYVDHVLSAPARSWTALRSPVRLAVEPAAGIVAANKLPPLSVRTGLSPRGAPEGDVEMGVLGGSSSPRNRGIGGLIVPGAGLLATVDPTTTTTDESYNPAVYDFYPNHNDHADPEHVLTDDGSGGGSGETSRTDSQGNHHSHDHHRPQSHPPVPHDDHDQPVFYPIMLPIDGAVPHTGQEHEHDHDRESETSVVEVREHSMQALESSRRDMGDFPDLEERLASLLQPQPLHLSVRPLPPALASVKQHGRDASTGSVIGLNTPGVDSTGVSPHGQFDSVTSTGRAPTFHHQHSASMSSSTSALSMPQFHHASNSQSSISLAGATASRHTHHLSLSTLSQPQPHQSLNASSEGVTPSFLSATPEAQSGAAHRKGSGASSNSGILPPFNFVAALWRAQESDGATARQMDPSPEPQDASSSPVVGSSLSPLPASHPLWTPPSLPLPIPPSLQQQQRAQQEQMEDLRAFAMQPPVSYSPPYSSGDSHDSQSR